MYVYIRTNKQITFSYGLLCMDDQLELIHNSSVRIPDVLLKT